MKIAIVVVAVLVALVVIVALVGAMLPVAHTASRAVRLPMSPTDVFAAITDVGSQPKWRQDLQRVEPLPERDGRRCYREVSSHGPMEFAVEESVPDRRLVTRIVTPNSPFGGTWTFTITAQDGGARLQITEHGEVYNVIFRALARFVFGHEATIEGYLKALAAKCGGAATIEPAEPEAPPARR